LHQGGDVKDSTALDLRMSTALQTRDAAFAWGLQVLTDQCAAAAVLPASSAAINVLCRACLLAQGEMRSLGANTMLPCSMAFYRAGADALGQSLPALISNLADNKVSGRRLFSILSD
jgi:hypothetical protein